MSLQIINELNGQNSIEESLKMLSAYICDHPESDEAFFMRGKLYWRLGERRKAMNDYARAVEINPQSPAAKALDNANAIQSFFNPDIFNP